MNSELNKLFKSGNDSFYYRNNHGWWIYHYQPAFTIHFGRGWLHLYMPDYDDLPGHPPPRQSSPLEFLLLTGDAFVPPNKRPTYKYRYI